MFNVYYINYAKAFEIAMQMDNKVLEQTIKDKGWDISGGVHGDVDAKQSFLDFLLPKLSGSVSLEGSKSSKTTDTIKVVSTKSTVLAPIVKKAIIIFTSNIDDNEYIKKIPPELRSRFDLVYKMALLTDSEKEAYIRYKTGYYVDKANALMGISLEADEIIGRMNASLVRMDNIRFITREIEQYIATVVEEQ